MDGLSSAASIIAVIQIAQSVGSALKAYYEDVRDAREDIRKIYYAPRSLEVILSSIQDIINGSHSESLLSITLFTDPSGPMRQCELELHKLRLELDVSPKTQRSFGKATQSLIWPFKKKDVEKLVQVTERCKSSLILETGLENLSLDLKHFDISADIRSEIRSAQDDDNRRQIIAWLSRGVPNPSKEHNLARERHEATTGSWLLDGNELQNWISAPNSFLWLNGGAGAGKSILCSTVIDHLQTHCKSELKSAVVYWYFTFTDLEKQKLSNSMCSIIADICSNRRDTPAGLQEAYDQANSGQQQPTIMSTMMMLKEVVSGFEHVYLIMDALDECPKSDGERSKLLDIIHEIRGWGVGSIHMLATSRREVDIEEFINSLDRDLGGFATVGVQGAHVEQDIKKYLQHRLQERTFQKWKPNLKIDVKDKLSSQAEGMFRLVSLQLDALSKLRAESKIRTAMEELPNTLDAFYDRILLDIEGDDDQEHARLALQWLAFAARPLRLEELAEAVIIRPENTPYLDDKDRLMEARDLLEVLPSGLVSAVAMPLDRNDKIIVKFDVDGSGSKEQNDYEDAEESTANKCHDSDDGSDIRGGSRKEEVEDRGDKNEGEGEQIGTKIMVQFAHFSVKEYLVSMRIAEGPALKYQVIQTSAHKLISNSCLAYLTFTGSQKPAITRQLYTDFPLLHYAADFWLHHMHMLGSQEMDGHLLKLALDFLQYGSYAWHVWSVVGFDDSLVFIDKYEALRRSKRLLRVEEILIHPITIISWFGLSCLLQHLLADDLDLDLNGIPQTPEYGNPLHIAVLKGNIREVKMLLAAGSVVNREGEIYRNALEAASAGCHVDICQLLIQEGADANALGGVYGTAIQAASSMGHIEIVQLLIQEGADVNALGGHHGTAIQAASIRGDIEVVRLLLQEGADMNALGGYHGTAIQAASIRGDIEVVRLLIQEGADVNALGGLYGTAIQAASLGGHIEIVQVLLPAGADSKSL